MAELLRRGLVGQSHTVEVAMDGVKGLEKAQGLPFDAIVLDVMLPGLDGLHVARRLRAAGIRVPILMLTARDSVPDIVRGLDVGADDYLTKPFSFEVLAARLRVIARRAAGPSEGVLQVADLSLNAETHEVHRGKKLLELTPNGRQSTDELRIHRVRLTAWYLVMLALGLGVFGVGSWFAMRASAFHTIDEELEDRIHGVEKFMQLQIASLSPVEIRDEFREHSVLGPGGSVSGVRRKGPGLYRSAVLERSEVPIRLPNQLGSAPVYENLSVQNTPVRFAIERVVVNDHPYTIQVAAPLYEFL